MDSPSALNPEPQEELAVRLQGPHGAQERDTMLKHLNDLQARLLGQLGGGGMGVAWAAELNAAEVKNIHTALVAVERAIEILNRIKLP